jgi:sialate O-acetylesterase
MGMLPRLTPVVLFFSALLSAGELKLVSLFSDHAVLQAGDAAVFGKAHPGSKVQVKLGSAEASAVAGNDGKWSATLAGLKPTEQGRDLVVSSGEETFTAHDVIVGEVWIGSGQSNMEWVVKNTTAAADAKSRPADAGLRVFTVARTPKAEPVEDVQGSWKLAAPDTVEWFTATGFYFARELRANLKQPVGVIHTSIGGTRAEAWGPKGMYADVPEAKDFDAKEAAGIKARAAALEKLQAKIASEKDKAALAKLKQDAGKLAPVWSNGPHMNWNGMVAPFVGYSFRGALWYQGESNAGQPEAYKWVLGSMIKSWQKAWGKEFPFIIVQLPRFMAKKPELAVEEGWPAIRESMEWIADNVPGAMMTVNIDLGEEKDIHPKDKLPVGERLAYVALQRVYKAREAGEAPRVKKAERRGDAWVLTYDRAVVLKNDGKGFALRAADGKWAFAQAKADGAEVTVAATGLKDPKEVRYAWANFPEVSVFSAGKDGLPAGPYRSGK